MNRRALTLLSLFIGLIGSAFSQSITEPPEFGAILVADQADSRIRLLTPENDPQTLWAFPPESEKGDQFKPTDAKRVVFEGVTHILAAYHGRVRLIRFHDRKVIKDFPSLPSCHSAELLPDGNLVTVNSNAGKLRLHVSAEQYTDHELLFAHGVSWDRAHTQLWALGDALYLYRYENGRLALQDQFPLPLAKSGHDLFPLHEGEALFVSNTPALFRFSIETKKFETISTILAIKSASQAQDGSIWITEPKQIPGAAAWQTDSVAQIQGDRIQKRLIRSGSRYYKARWWQKVGFSYEEPR